MGKVDRLLKVQQVKKERLKMASVNRRLTSILATDCVGFSSLMEKDEEKTLDNLRPVVPL